MRRFIRSEKLGAPSVLALLLLIGCANAKFSTGSETGPPLTSVPRQAEATKSPEIPKPTDVPFDALQKTSLDLGSANGIERVARTPEELMSLWHELDGDRAGPPPLEKVDFSQETVILISMGMKPVMGYFVEILSARRAKGCIVVRYRFNDPPTPVNPTATDTPGVLAKLQDVGTPICFVED